MKRINAFAAISALILGGLTAASATTLSPGGSSAATVYTVGAGATQVAGEGGLTTALTFTDGYIATVVSDPNNVFCAGCLDFTYTFEDSGPGINERFSAYNFTGFSTAVGIESVGQNVSPLTVDRSSDGSVIGFNYTGADSLTSGNTTSILIVETNALYFTTGTFTIQDGSTSTVMGYAPAAAPAVPEPSSLALLGTGVSGLAMLVRRRRSA